jgi:pilus assembly protein FimV
MFVTLPRFVLMACLLSPSLSWALGLGEIHLNSALNEPMNAEIDLIAAGPDELAALRAALAPKEAFTRYGIDRPPFLSTLTFKVAKSKDGRDVLEVRSTDSIPEPFVTFLVEVNWARGRLMREYTVLLDPPVYTPGERASSAAPVAAATTAPSAPAAAPPTRARPAPVAASQAPADSTATPATPKRSSRASRSAGRASSASSAPSSAAASSAAATSAAATSTPESSAESTPSIAEGSYRVAQGDTLTKIARSMRASSRGDIDQAMIAMYRANPEAFGGNINILRRGAVLRVPGGDEIAALNQSEAMSEVHRQMDAWRGNSTTASSGHLRLVTPGAGSGTANSSSDSAAGGEAQALKGRVKDLEGQLADAHRLLDLKSNELSELQRKLAGTTAPTPAPPPQTAMAPKVVPAPPPTPVETQPTTPESTAPTTTPPPAPVENTTTPTPLPAPPPVQKPVVAKKPVPAPSGSLIDWLEQNWWLPAAVILVLFAGLAFNSWRRRQESSGGGSGGDFPGLDSTDITEYRDPTARIAANRGGDDSFVVEESGEHRMPEFNEPAAHYGETTADLKAPDDTMSSESAVNLDQGDPLAEADFHMAYGLYDQAADLVRIALEREPDRRDLRLKLLEIYFVWGNKEAFLQTAKSLEATRDRAPAGEWDKIVIMGKQICPDEPLFAASAGSGRGAGALVDLNLEGGENRVDIDLFGDPEGERSIDQTIAKDIDDTAATGESPSPHPSTDLDFTLDHAERGADSSPTREMPPARDEPTVESELMNFSDAPTAESPTLKPTDVRDRISSKLDKGNKAEQTAELSIEDLGLDLDHLEGAASGASISIPQLEETDHPSDAPTMVAGLDEKSRRMMAEAESRARDKDLTELERELEASFVADLGTDQEEIKTAVLGPESAPTVQMPRGSQDPVPTSKFKSPEYSDVQEPDRGDVDSTSRMRGLNADSIDLDLDRLANALGSGDTIEQPRAEDEVFSTEVFEASQRNRKVDLDVGEALNGSEPATNKLKTISTQRTSKIRTEELALPELEPVTMSEVGTKLDLARAYMDMGDPEGARSILEEVVSEGSASQKQEAQRLIENLPG